MSGRKSDSLLVDVGRFLVLRDDGVSVLTDGIHCLSEAAGLFDGENVDGDWIGRGPSRWGSESLGESGTFVVRGESS